MKIGFTGTREGMTVEQKISFVRLMGELILDKYSHWGFEFQFHHGDCVGADSEVHDIMRMIYGNSVFITIHPPNKKEHWADKSKNEPFKHCMALPPKDYLERNKDIVKATEILIACPKEFEKQKTGGGTWFTYSYALSLKRRIKMINPSGGIITRHPQM